MTDLGARIKDYLNDDAEARLKNYYTGYTGRRFDTLGGGGSRPETRDQFAADDIVAVSLLGVNVPSRAVLEILELQAQPLGQLLSRIPSDIDLWGAEPDEINSGSSADTLWRRLEGMDGIGWVTAGKLLARKRPRLIPVFDRVVKAALLPTQSGTWWASLHAALQDKAITRRLATLKATTQLPEQVSLLRVLDVSVWMTSQALGQS